MVFTSVTGHLMELEFSQPTHRRWRGCAPGELFSAPVAKRVASDKQPVADNLTQRARQASMVVLWLDCDREGENIAHEVLDVVLAANSRLQVRRARFSSLVRPELERAVARLGQPNAHESQAVDVRQELDLRVGASFTRFQTLLLQEKFDFGAGAGGGGGGGGFGGGGHNHHHHHPHGSNANQHPSAASSAGPILSYGPCQFPTLGLIVQREWEIQSHVPEPFWTVRLVLGAAREVGGGGGGEGAGGGEQHQHHQHQQPHAPPPTTQTAVFDWCRGRLFDRDAAALLYEACLETGPVATIASVRGARRSRPPPFPLETLELQKRATSALRLPGQRVMELAEELYQQGYLSYPRTATSKFSRETDLAAIVRAQAGGAGGGNGGNGASSQLPWQEYAQRLAASLPPNAGPGANGLPDGLYRWPRDGPNDDGAHPPIHPTRPADAAAWAAWPREKRGVYEFVARHFLACVSADAVGYETVVEAEVASERFRASGLVVTERNWLEVYPYAGGAWGGGGGGGGAGGGNGAGASSSGELPPFREGQRLLPDALTLEHSHTQPPRPLSERDLIAAMERHGIGTDATVAEHIQKQLSRGYATKCARTLAFSPTGLGQALISAYRRANLDALWRPDLRARIEAGIDRVARGLAAPGEVLAGGVAAFRADFESALSRAGLIEAEVGRFFPRRGVTGGGGGGFGGGAGGWGGGGGGGGGGPGGGGPSSLQQQQQALPPLADGEEALGPCVQCGGRVRLLRGPPLAVECSSSGVCPRRRLALPSAVVAASVRDGGGEACPSCSAAVAAAWAAAGNGGASASQLPPLFFKARLRLRLALLPPGLFDEPEYVGCLACDARVRQLIEACGRPAGAGGGGGGGGAAGGGGGSRGPGQFRSAPPQNQHQQQQYQQQSQQQQHHFYQQQQQQPYQQQQQQQQPQQRRQQQQARRAAAAGSDNDAPPLCPHHGQPVVVRTAGASSAHAGRVYYKCSHPTENKECLEFCWADQWAERGCGGGGGGRAAPAAAPAAAGRRGANSRIAASGAYQQARTMPAAGAGGGGASGSGRQAAAGGRGGRGGRGGSAGGRGGRGRGAAAAGGCGFVRADGSAPGNACYRCGEPGHFASNCPN
jgi:DNA topoisomerase-3